MSNSLPLAQALGLPCGGKKFTPPGDGSRVRMGSRRQVRTAAKPSSRENQLPPFSEGYCRLQTSSEKTSPQNKQDNREGLTVGLLKEKPQPSSPKTFEQRTEASAPESSVNKARARKELLQQRAQSGNYSPEAQAQFEKILKIYDMSEEEVRGKLKSYESTIEQLIQKGENAKVNRIFNKKLELISTRISKHLKAIAEFFEPGKFVFSLRPTNEKEILGSETNESNHSNVLKKPEDKIIQDLVLKNYSLIEKGNYIEALEVADECNNRISERLRRWERSLSQQEELAEVNTDPSRIYQILQCNSWNYEQKIKHLRSYLIHDLEEADQLRGMSTPRDQVGRATHLDELTYDNSETRTHLVNELKNSPFKHFVIQFQKELRLKTIVKTEHHFIAETETTRPILRTKLTNDVEATIRYLASEAPGYQLKAIFSMLDFLSDLARYNGNFTAMARSLLEAGSDNSDSITKESIDNFVAFQMFIKKLSKISPTHTPRELISIYKYLSTREEDFAVAFNKGLTGYTRLISKIKDIQNPEKIMSFPGTAEELEENIKTEISNYLPDGCLVGRRMQMSINQMVCTGIFDHILQVFSNNKATSARISLEIAEDLLASKGLQKRIAEIEEYVRAEEGTFLEEEGSFAEFSASEEAENQQQETSTQPREPECSVSTNATRPKRPMPSASITQEIYELIGFWCWEPFRGHNVLNIDGPLGRRVRLTIPGLVHIFRRHYYKTADPALLKSKNSLIGPEVEVWQIIPMIKELVNNMNSKQLEQHYDKMPRISNKNIYKINSPYRAAPYWRTDEIETLYGDTPYSLLLRNDDVLSVYPRNQNG